MNDFSNEDEFVEFLKQKIEEELEKKYKGKYEVRYKANLIYRIFINYELNLIPSDLQNPTRGDNSFQTDLAIFHKEKKIPLVVMEIKFKEFTTHDVIVYSYKAIKHKEIYPYLRYGLVVNTDKITNKFFIHNHGFDFAFAYNYKIEGIDKELINIIQSQIKNSELILDIMKNKNETLSFTTEIKIKK